LNHKFEYIKKFFVFLNLYKKLKEMNCNELGLIKLKLNSTKIFLIFPKWSFKLFKFKNSYTYG